MAIATVILRNVEFHPAANIFPLMNVQEFYGLVADMREHGLRESIKLYQGRIVDGRNRYRACLLGAAPPDYENMDFANDDEVMDFVVSQNLHRRHLKPSQLAMVAAAAREFHEQAAKERQKAAGGDRAKKALVENLPQADKGKARLQ